MVGLRRVKLSMGWMKVLENKIISIAANLLVWEQDNEQMTEYFV